MDAAYNTNCKVFSIAKFLINTTWADIKGYLYVFGGEGGSIWPSSIFDFLDL